MRSPICIFGAASTLTLVASASAQTFSNSASITISPGLPATATPYPSAISVAGLSNGGNLADVNVSINGLTHTWCSDIDMVVVSPSGAACMLLSDAGGSGDPSGNYVFDDAAAGAFTVTPGTYKPTNIDDANADTFAPPGPGTIAPGTPLLSIFNNTNGNGIWNLYVVDDVNSDGGAINGGWSVVLTTGGGNPCGTPLPVCAADISNDGTINVTDLLEVISGWGQTGPPRPNADCGPLPNGDCTVNVTDLLEVISGWGSCGGGPTGACVVLPGNCSIVTQAQCAALGGIVWEAGQTCADNDGDRIPNFCELNNCAALSGGKVGTNPNVADTDGDNIKDGDEIYGTMASPSLNLPALGANALRKNYFIEVDWFDETLGTAPATHTHRPIDGATNALIAAFAAAPVTNVCGGPGITLVIDKGQGGALTGGNLIPGGDTNVLFDSEFNTYKAANFAANRNGYFFYSIHCHQYNGGFSSGVAEINGDDHIVSLQTFLGASDVSKTMMHEFGHNIGLRHGGNEDLNYKPNYNSIMNYRFQFPGTDTNCDAQGDGALNYSIGTRIALNENSLSEPAGVCGATAINWNGDGDSTDTGLSRNINCDVNFSTACGSGSGSCWDTTCVTLNDFNDWGNIVFTGLNNADFAPPEIVTCDAPRLPSERPPARN